MGDVQGSLAIAAGTVTLTALVASALVWGVRHYAIRRNVVDYPGARSSHERPTPRGGGVGIVLPVIAYLAVSPLGGARWPVPIAVVAVALVGWLDDHRPLSFRPRLLVHLGAGLAVAWSALLLGVVDVIPGMSVALGYAWWIFWSVSAINVTNFMDGVDGMIGLQAAIFALFAAVALRGHDLALFPLVLFGACLGFLAFNWPPARIFMGDVGSGAIGLLFVVLGMLTMGSRGWTIVHAFLPLMPLFTDEVVTMSRRIKQRESLTQPHRTHVYQRLVQSGWSHAKVSVLYGAAAVVCAVWALLVPRWSATFVAGAFILFIVTALGMLRARMVAENQIASRAIESS